MAHLKINTENNTVVFTAKVVPSSSKTAIAGTLDGMLKVKVAAPPENGKANRTLIDFLAKKLGIKKNNVTIMSGKTSPVKKLVISGITKETMLKKLNLDK